jgi:8-amino-7-oxononanoate synthase
LDIFEKCFKFTRAQETIQAGIYPYFVPLSGNDGPVVQMDGKEVIMIGSNNYLGLTHDRRVIEAAVEATRKYGTSCSGSRFLNGTLDLHIELEEKIAQFFDREAALIFSTGYMSNLGSIATLVERNDCILMDKSDHASIYAGILSVPGLCIKRYLHNDMHSLEKMISDLDPDKAKIIISDGVFSMEGDIVNLEDLVKVAKKYDARVYLDEAHGLGVLGEHGRGSAEHLGLESEVDIIMSTFSKSLASLGGFITGSKAVIDYIKHKANPLIFSAAPTPAATATVMKTLDIIQNEPEHMRRLSKISEKMRRELKSLGFDIGISKDTPIIPIYIRNDEKTFMFWRQLFDNGVFANAVISPAVAPDEALIRTSFMSTHSDEHLDKVLHIIENVAKGLGII